MAQVEINGKVILDWFFRLLALGAPIAIGWAWDTGRDMALMQQAQETNESALVEKLSDLEEDYREKLADQKDDYDQKIHVIKTAFDKEVEHLKGQMQKVELIGKQADQNALKLVEIDVKMDQARDTLDEIKKAVLDR